MLFAGTLDNVGSALLIDRPIHWNKRLNCVSWFCNYNRQSCHFSFTDSSSATGKCLMTQYGAGIGEGSAVSKQVDSAWLTWLRLNGTLLPRHTLFENVVLCCPFIHIVPFAATLKGHREARRRAAANLPPAFLFIFMWRLRAWTSRTDLQRAGGLILLDKKPLSAQFLERESETTRDGCKTSKTFKIPLSPLTPSLSIPPCHHFICPLSALFREGGEAGGKVGSTWP